MRIAKLRWSWWALAILCGVADVSVSADLSPQARLGRRLFFDPSLSASGALSCASCHDPNNAYAAPASTPVVMNGGPKLDQPGARAVPSLRYLAQTPRFARHLYLDSGAEREDIGPAGGLMLDGRVDGLQEQALLPLLDPREMANRTVEDLGRRLRGVAYLGEFQTAFDELSTRAQALTLQAAQALARFEAEDPSFRPYDSRFDRYLRGAQTLSPQEISGLKLFLDPAKGNCAACHTASIGPGGRGAGLHRLQLPCLGRAAKPRHSGQSRPRIFRSGTVWAAAHRPAQRSGILRVLQDADFAQCRPTCILLPQRPIHELRGRAALLRAA